jgi:WD40 repeat protein
MSWLSWCQKLSITGLIGCGFSIAVIPTLANTDHQPQISPYIAQNSPNNVTVGEIKGLTGVITSLAISPNGRILLIATGDGMITAIDVEKSQPIYTNSSFLEPRYLAISQDGQFFAAALKNEIALFSLKDGKQIKKWPAHVEKITQLAISPDNQLIVSISGAENTTKIWELNTGKLLKTIGEDQGFVTALAFSPDGKVLVTAASGQDRTLKIWDVANWTLLKKSAPQFGHIYDLVITPNGQKVVAAIRNFINVWNLETGKELLSLKVAALDLNAIAISPNNKLIATAEKEGTISLVDITRGQIVTKLPGHKGWVTDLVFSPDGKLLYSGGEDKIIKIWHLDN